MYTTYGPGDAITWGGNRPYHDDDIPDLVMSNAKDEFLARPSDVAEYLSTKATTQYGQSIDVYRLSDDLTQLNVDELLTLMFVGTNQQCLDARFELVSRIERDCEPAITKIALANMSHGDEPDPYADDAHLWF